MITFTDMCEPWTVIAVAQPAHAHSRLRRCVGLGDLIKKASVRGHILCSVVLRKAMAPVFAESREPIESSLTHSGVCVCVCVYVSE